MIRTDKLKGKSAFKGQKPQSKLLRQTNAVCHDWLVLTKRGTETEMDSYYNANNYRYITTINSSRLKQTSSTFSGLNEVLQCNFFRPIFLSCVYLFFYTISKYKSTSNHVKQGISIPGHQQMTEQRLMAINVVFSPLYEEIAHLASVTF